MKVLIVEANPSLARLWGSHLGRHGIDVIVAKDDEAALAFLRDIQPAVIVADLDLPASGAMAVADYSGYRYPDVRVVFVTASSFFSDGSIFAACPNACAFLPARTPAEDLAAVVEFHARRKAAEA